MLCQEVTSTSKTIKDVAVACGVGPETLRNWLIKYRAAHGGTEAELTLDERSDSRSSNGLFRTFGPRRRS